jgi:tetratricopeptide (TPR) repeat protein
MALSPPNERNLIEAAQLLRGGQAEAARQACLTLLRLRPDHPAALLLLGRAARTLGDLSGSAAAFRRAADLEPGRPEAAFLLCAVLLQSGDPQAQAVLGGLLDRFPGHSVGWEDLGRTLYEAGKLEAALVCFTRAAKAAPSFPLAMRRGAILRSLGRLPAAIEAFQAAVALKTDAATAWFWLGLCHQDQAELPAAADAYRAALRRDGTLAEAAVNLGTVLQGQGRLEEAKQVYGLALRQRPDSFGRIAQALTTSPKGELWLDLARLRARLAG